MSMHSTILQIQETAKLHELAAQQGFAVYLLVFFCTVLMYVVVAFWKKNERLNEQLINYYKENSKIDEQLTIISQNINRKDYQALEDQVRALQQNRNTGTV